MPTVSNRKLTLTTVNSNVTIKVTFDVTFSEFERHLAALGLVFKEHIEVLGIDPPGGFVGTNITNFTMGDLPVTDGSGFFKLSRSRSITVTRASLQEDSGVGDDDEILCKVQILAVGLPPAITPEVYTNHQTLLG